MIGCCISLYELNKLRRLMIVQCIKLTIECAIQQVILSNQIHKYLLKIKQFILDSEKGAVQNEWISVAYSICFNVCIIYYVLIYHPYKKYFI
jgi:hypothetical protein